jgi:hypothetical protein
VPPQPFNNASAIAGIIQIDFFIAI